jgi:hypothetical protein
MMDWWLKYIGIPFCQYGRDIALDGGLDCLGLVIEVYKNELNIEIPSFLEQSRHAQEGRGRFDAISAVHNVIASEIDRYFDRVETPHEFDMAAFHRFGAIWHLGIFINPFEILHLQQDKSCIEPIISPQFSLDGVYRLKGRE